MSRLIDADRFVDNHRKWYCDDCERRKNGKGKFIYDVGGVPCRACYIGDMINDVDDSPTVDAMPVVRCKDCVHCLKDRYSDGNVPTYSCKMWDSGTEAEGYCHYGERREDGKEQRQ